jgi:hypothetical protein
MLSQRLANPDILAVLGTNEQYKVVSSGIVRVEQIRDYAQQAEASRQEDEFIFIAQLSEDVLLEFL